MSPGLAGDAIPNWWSGTRWSPERLARAEADYILGLLDRRREEVVAGSWTVRCPEAMVRTVMEHHVHEVVSLSWGDDPGRQVLDAYLSAMTLIGADRGPGEAFVQSLDLGANVQAAVDRAGLPEGAARFVVERHRRLGFAGPDELLGMAFYRWEMLAVHLEALARLTGIKGAPRFSGEPLRLITSGCYWSLRARRLLDLSLALQRRGPPGWRSVLRTLERSIAEDQLLEHSIAESAAGRPVPPVAFLLDQPGRTTFDGVRGAMLRVLDQQGAASIPELAHELGVDAETLELAAASAFTDSLIVRRLSPGSGPTFALSPRGEAELAAWRVDVSEARRAAGAGRRSFGELAE